MHTLRMLSERPVRRGVDSALARWGLDVSDLGVRMRQMRSEKFGGYVNTSYSLLCSPNIPETLLNDRGCIILLKEVTAIRGLQPCLGRWCKTHMDGRTQGFTVEHSPERHTAATSLPSSHSASW